MCYNKHTFKPDKGGFHHDESIIAVALALVLAIGCLGASAESDKVSLQFLFPVQLEVLQQYV
jgi:hypothetical protein